MIYKILLAFVTGLSVGATVTYFIVMWRLDGVCKVLGMAIKEMGCYNSTEQVIKSNIEAAESAKDVDMVDCNLCGFTQTGAIMCCNVTNKPKLCRDFIPIDEVPEPEPDYPLDLGVKPITFDNNEGADNG